MPMRKLPRSPWANCCKRLGQIQLRQHAIGHRQQVLTRLRQAQAAPFTQPDIGAELGSSFLMLWLRADWVTHNTSAAAVKEPCFSTSCTMARWIRSIICEHNSWIHEKQPFYFMHRFQEHPVR
jgi:hypothetical protein